MKSPLRIFTKTQLETLNDYNLKLLKKEFFIPFKFGGKTSIVLNNHEVDEKTLTAIFNELEGNLEEFLIGAKNKLLYDFLDRGKLDFLFNDKDFNEIRELISKHPKLEFRVADQFAVIIPKLCKNLNNQSVNTLHIIGTLTEGFDLKNQEHAYKYAHHDFEQYISTLWNDFSNPFKGHKVVNYRNEIGLIVDPMRSKILSVLPVSFDIFDYKYSKWCEEVIVNKSVVRQSDFNQYDKRALKVFIDAAQIAQKEAKSEQLEYYLKSARIALSGGGKQKKGLSFIGAIVGVLLLIRIVVGIGKCTQSSSQSNRNSNIFDQQDIFTDLEREELNRRVREEYYKRLEREENKRKSSASSSEISEDKIQNDDLSKNEKPVNKQASVSNKNVPKIEDTKSPIKPNKKRKNRLYFSTPIKTINKKFNGEDIDNLDLKLTKSSYKADTINLEFSTDMIPFADINLGSLLPEAVVKGGKNKTAAAYITFYNSELNIRTKHLVDIFYNLDDQPPSTMYTRKSNSTGSKLTLRAKRVPYSDYNLKGTMILKDVENGSVKEKLSFTIKYAPIQKSYVIKYGKNKKLILTLENIKDPSSIKFDNTIGKKFAAIISNLKILQNTYLKEKNYYAIRKIKEYSLNVDLSLIENTNAIELGKGSARFSFASAADQYAYCEINTDKTSYKYIFDHKTGIVEGMTRVTTGYNKSVVEQIIVFRQ